MGLSAERVRAAVTDLIDKMERRQTMEQRQAAQVLSERELAFLESAEQGTLLCPDCWEPLEGELVDMPGFFVGLLLTCGECSFVEALSAPARSRVESIGEMPYSQDPTTADMCIRDKDLLEKAGEGNLPCPWCGRPLRGELVYIELEDDDSYTGVRLSCSCGFVEY
jgi:hypothetical protein